MGRTGGSLGRQTATDIATDLTHHDRQALERRRRQPQAEVVAAVNACTDLLQRDVLRTTANIEVADGRISVGADDHEIDGVTGLVAVTLPGPGPRSLLRNLKRREIFGIDTAWHEQHIVIGVVVDLDPHGLDFLLVEINVECRVEPLPRVARIMQDRRRNARAARKEQP